MRVVHISKVTGVAGSERHLLMLLTGLRKRGIEASMLVLEDPVRSPEAFYAALTKRSIPFEIVPIHGHLDPGLTQRLAHILRSQAPDVVHTHLIHGDLYGLRAARQAGFPATISSRHNDNPFRRNPVVKMAIRAAMHRADRVIAISAALADFVTQTEGVPAEKVTVIRYGLEPRSYPPDAVAQAHTRLKLPLEVPVVGFFGRLIAQKGVDVLLEAFTRLRPAHPDARLIIVGDGDQRDNLETQAAALGLETCVTFTGWVDDAAVLMLGCDVIAMPSRWEGFGLVALEAMNARRPLVASQVSALPEIVVEGETGRLVPPDDPEQLAKAIGGLLAAPDQARAMAEAGYARLVDKFGVEQMVEQTVAVYRQVSSSHEEETSQP